MSSKDGVEYTAPCGGGKHLDGSNVVVGRFGVHRSEGDGRCDGGKEDEEGNGDGLLVEVGEFLAPPYSDGPLEFFDDGPSAVSVSFIFMMFSDPWWTKLGIVLEGFNWIGIFAHCVGRMKDVSSKEQFFLV